MRNIVNEIKDQALREMKEYPYSERGVKALLKRVYLRSFQKDNHYTWANALVANGFWNLYQQTNEEEYLSYVKEYCDGVIRAGILPRYVDDLLNAYIMECLMNNSGNSDYEKYTDACFTFALNSEINGEGSFIYRPNISDIVLIDSLGMTCPFLFAYGKRKDNETAKKIAMAQINNYYRYGFDLESGLPYHGYSLNDSMKVGIIGWGRAIGWIMMALVDSRQFCDEKEELDSYLTPLISKVVKYQNPNGYFKWQLQAIEGQNDSSATAMIGYALSQYQRISGSKEYRGVIFSSINAIGKGIVAGKDTQCSGESGGYGRYSQNYGSYPWGTGSILSFCAFCDE